LASGGASGGGAGSGGSPSGPRVTIINEQLQVYRLWMGAPVRTVACGALHTLAALEGGGVLGWGDNASGQAVGRAGLPGVRVTSPTRIAEFDHVEVVSLAAGLQHSAAVTSSGAVWCWGSNRHGRLGIGASMPPSARTTTSTSGLPTPGLPCPSPTSSPGRGPFGADRERDRDPLPNTAAMLAHAGVTPDAVHDDVKRGLTHPPTPVLLPSGVRITSVVCGTRHCLALTEDGAVWGWGSNAVQALGLPDFRDRPTPMRVPGLPPCAMLAAWSVSAAISREGQLYLWGSDPYLNPWVQRNRVGGPAGTAMTPRSASLPLIHRVKWLGPHRFRTVSVGARHAVAVTTHQRMYWWGDEELLPSAMQYGVTRSVHEHTKLVVKPPSPEDFLPLPPPEATFDGSVPPPPPPPSDPRTQGLYYVQSASIINRLTAFRLFNARDGPRPSDGLGTLNSGAFTGFDVTISGAGGHSPPITSFSGFSPNSPVGRHSASADGHDGITLRLHTFNERVYVSIRTRRPGPPRIGGVASGSFFSVAGSYAGSAYGGGGGGAVSSGGGRVSSTLLSAEASLAGGFAGSSSARSVATPGSAAGGGGGGGGGGGPAALFSGEEPVMLVACGEGHTLCLCGQTRYNVTLDELRHTLMLVLRQYARHWHACRRAVQAKLAGGVPNRVRSRSLDRRPSSARSGRSSHGLGRMGALPAQHEIFASSLPYIDLEERPTDPRDELCSLDMLLVFCRQAGLIDNISEYNDVIELYRVQITNKHARVPPSQQQAAEAAAAANSNNPTGPINMLPVRVHAALPDLRKTLQLRSSEYDGRTSKVGFGAAHSSPPGISGGGAPGAVPYGRSGDGMTSPLPSRGGGGGGGGGRLSPLSLRLPGMAAGGSLPVTPTGIGRGGTGLGDISPVPLAREDSGGSTSGAAAAAGGGGGRLGSAPSSPDRAVGAPPSLRVVDMRAFMPRSGRDDSSASDERLRDSDVLDLLLGLMQNRQVASSSKANLPMPALMQQLAAKHVGRLKRTACAAPLPWVLGQAIRTEMLRALDSGPNSLTLHQAYIYLSSEHSAPQDLHLSMQDMRLGLAQVEQPFTVPLLRLAQFIRQSGLLPKLISRLITHMHKHAEYYLDRLAVADQVPWWWPPEVLRDRRAAVSGVGISPTLWQRPDTIAMWQQPAAMNLLGLETIAGVVYDFDILGVYYGTTRKAIRNQLSSEEQVALEHAKRDRLLAYVLVYMMGQYLVRVDHPHDMRPEHILTAAVSYPQFVEILAFCLSLKAATQTPTGAVMPSVQLLPTLGDTLQYLPGLLEAVGLWREKILYPWKFNRVKHNDVELQRQVDRAFSLYCTIDPLAQTLGINIYQFTKLIRDTDMADKTLTMERIQEVFAAVALVRVRSVPALRSRTGANPNRQNDNMEWTGLTAAQIIRLSTSQFAYTVAQHKLEEHLQLREMAMAAWRPRDPASAPPHHGFSGSGVAPALMAPGGGSPTGGTATGAAGGVGATVSLALALKEAAQRTANEVDEAAIGIVGPNSARSAWGPPSPPTAHRQQPFASAVGIAAAAAAGRTVTSPEGGPPPGSAAAAAAAVAAGAGSPHQRLAVSNAATAAAVAASSAFVSKLRRPGGRRGDGGKPRDLAGLLRNRRHSSTQVSFAPMDSSSGLPQGLSALVVGLQDVATSQSTSRSASQLLGAGGPESTVDGAMPSGFGGCGTDDEMDLGLSWPSFTTEQFGDSDLGTPSGPNGSPRTSPQRSGRSPPRPGQPPSSAPQPPSSTLQCSSTGTGGTSGTGAMSPAVPSPGGSTNDLAASVRSPERQLATPGSSSGRWPSLPEQSELSLRNMEHMFAALQPPEGPLPAPPPPAALTDESDREGGGSGGDSSNGRDRRRMSRASGGGGGMSPERGSNSQLGEGRGSGSGGARGSSSGREPSAVLKRRRVPGMSVAVAFGSGTARRTFVDVPPELTSPSTASLDLDGRDRSRGGKSARRASSGAAASAGVSARGGSPLRNSHNPNKNTRASGGGGPRSPFSTSAADAAADGAGAGGGPTRVTQGSSSLSGSDWAASADTSPDRAGGGGRQFEPWSTSFDRSRLRTPPSPLGPSGANARVASMPMLPRDAASPGGVDRAMLMRMNSERPASRTSQRSSVLGGDSAGSRSPSVQRPDSAASSSVIGSVNRLVLTKHALATTGDGKSAKKLSAQPGKLLTREQFSEVVQRLAVVKYSKISSPMAAWRLLIERHVLPVVETRSTKFDRYLEELMGPSIMSLVLAWEPQLKALFRIYGKDEYKQTTGRPPGTANSASSRPGTSASGSGGSHRGHSRSRTAPPRGGGGGGGRSASPQPHNRSPSTLEARGRSRPGTSAGDPRGSGSSTPNRDRDPGSRITMSFVQFLQLCQDRKIIPALIQPAGLEEIFRRVNFMDGVESYIRNMAYPQFVDAVCLTAMTIYNHPKYKEQSMTVEDMLETFFSQLCSLKRARTRVTHLGAMDNAAAAAAAAARGAGAVVNPYAQWWTLRFEPEAAWGTGAGGGGGGGGRGGGGGGKPGGWSFLSSVDYAPVLLQEVVIPPPPVPEPVSMLLQHAASLHNRGSCTAALAEYDRAAGAWRAALSGEGTLPFEATLSLSPEQEIYLCLVRASVLMSCGQDSAAMSEYSAAEGHMRRLPEGHPAEPLIHSCRGHLLYHVGQLQAAFEQLVQAKVLREQHPDMGSHHVDTALAHNNLACCLDRLGKTHLALRLLAGAVETFRVVLGSSHPRTQTAARNVRHMQHRLVKLDLHYRSVAQEQAEAEQAAIIEALHRAAGRGLRGRRPGIDNLYSLNGPRISLALRREQANAALAAAATAAAVMAPRRLEPLKMPAKERLAAFQLRVHGAAGATYGRGAAGASGAASGGASDRDPGGRSSGDGEGDTDADGEGGRSSADGDTAADSPPETPSAVQLYTRRRNGIKYYRSKHDLDYLGGGLHRPHPDMVATYDAMKADIAAHASGAVHARVPEGVVVVQRGAGGPVQPPPRRSTVSARGSASAAAAAAAAARAAEEVPGPVRAYRGGVYDKTLTPRRLKVERRYGLPLPPPPEPTLPGRERGLQARRANVLAAAMLDELSSRLTGTGVGLGRSVPVLDRLADVLRGTAGPPPPPSNKIGRGSAAAGTAGGDGASRKVSRGRSSVA
ncbi:hypothetical protein Agub_g3309, partial [Astrephomene gubernaculifera]